MDSKSVALLFLWLVCFQRVVSDEWRPPRVSVFEPRPLTHKWTLDIFFQMPGKDISHAWTRVFYCQNVNAITINTLANKCSPRSLHLDQLMQRLYPTFRGVTKAVFLQVERQTCQKIELLRESLASAPQYSGAFIGMRLLKGPNSNIAAATAEELQCITKPVAISSHVIVLMFDEHPLKPNQANTGYTAEQLGTILDIISDTDVYYVALDALFLSETPRTLLETYMKSLNIIIYQLEGQRLPELGLLRYQFAVLSHVAKDNNGVQVLLPRLKVDRMHSYLPNVDWSQRVAPWQDLFVNPVIFHEYLANGIPLIHMQVRTRNNQHVLNDKDSSAMLRVTLERALQFITPTRRMLFEFDEPENHHLYTPFAWYDRGTKPLLLIRMAKGPNYNGDRLADMNAIHIVEGATYVLGFGERRGQRWAYTEEDVAQLVAVMETKFKGSAVGVFLCAEFLVEQMNVDIFAKLMALPEFQFVYLRVGLIMSRWNPPLDRLKILKWNVRQLGRETIFHAEFGLQRKFYQWEEINPSNIIKPRPSPSPPTLVPAPLTTKAEPETNPKTEPQPEPQTEADTDPPPIVINSIAYTSPDTPPTSTVFLNFSKITFPTKSGSTRTLKVLGAIDVVVAIVFAAFVWLVLSKEL